VSGENASEVNPSRCCIVHHISEIKRLSDVATSISLSTTSCYIKAELGQDSQYLPPRSGRTSQIGYLNLRCSIIVSRESNKACRFCKNSSLVEKNCTYCGAEYGGVGISEELEQPNAGISIVVANLQRPSDNLVDD